MQHEKAIKMYKNLVIPPTRQYGDATCPEMKHCGFGYFENLVAVHSHRTRLGKTHETMASEKLWFFDIRLWKLKPIRARALCP